MDESQKTSLKQCLMVQMVQNGLILPNMAQNDPKWHEFVLNGPKLSILVQIVSKVCQMVQNVEENFYLFRKVQHFPGGFIPLQKWFKIVPNGSGITKYPGLVFIKESYPVITTLVRKKCEIIIMITYQLRCPNLRIA